jgi:hypothetical protein
MSWAPPSQAVHVKCCSREPDSARPDVARFLLYVFVVIFPVLLIIGLTIFRA